MDKEFKIRQLNSGSFRFYEVEPKVYYPSVTTILGNGLPTPRYLINWFKQNGFMSDHLVDRASKDGTLIHNCVESLLQGGEFTYEEFMGREYLYEMILKYAFFHTEHVVEILDIEKMGVSHKLKTAGTRDLRARLSDGRVWIIDFKTSNYMNEKMEYQTLAYKQMCVEEGVEVDARGVLHLKAKTRGKDKRGKKIQGQGWQLIEHFDDAHDTEMFELATDMFWRVNPTAKPAHKLYPEVINLSMEYYEEDYKLEQEDTNE